VGFRPHAGPLGWLAAAGVILAAASAFTWLAVALGLGAKTPAGANSVTQIISSVLPFLSSAFVPAASMAPGIRWFAESSHSLPSSTAFVRCYRRYTAHHAIELIKIRTLAEAGVPLPRVRELCDAGPGEFARAVQEIDRDLEERIAALTRARHRIRGLPGGDRLFVPEEIAGCLDHRRALGLSARYVQIERDLWILLWAVQPKEAADQLRDRLSALTAAEMTAPGNDRSSDHRRHRVKMSEGGVREQSLLRGRAAGAISPPARAGPRPAGTAARSAR
jgi:DNA-binding transcriptional MerR regulator